MTCHHKAGDPACGQAARDAAAYDAKHRETRLQNEHNVELAKLRAAMPTTPDASSYEIVTSARVGPHLVLKVLYPNCSKCSFEGNKVMVFLNVTEAEVLRWKVIDPHFRDPGKPRPPREAPGPAARFPCSDEGWKDALAYAACKPRA